jgi:spore maturation protein CgeB
MKVNRQSILIVGSFAKGALENQFIRGFMNLGLKVHKFDIVMQSLFFSNNIIKKVGSKFYRPFFLQKKNSELVKCCSILKPDIILIFKGMNIYPETVKTLKTYTQIICNYNPDHPFLFFSNGSGNDFVKNSIPYYDIYISYSSNITEKLKSIYNKNAYCLPFGYDETVQTSYVRDVSDCFVFIGAWDKEREAFFNQLPKLPIKIFGPAWDKSKNNSYNYYQNRNLLENEYYSTSQSALGCINLLREQNIVEDSHNMRTFEVPGIGGLLISQRTNEQLNFFEENKEAIYFSDVNELIDKIKAIKKGLFNIEQIKKNALNRSVRSNYSYQCRVKDLFNIFSLYI